uniref:Uncharacterized protein n=1 Tax=Picea sitchensis TaxID=3332 RepID=A9NLG3_PICSI|nr:unknown [Picea sitchensis]ABK26656.1 unknown [Picea sitchensis]
MRVSWESFTAHTAPAPILRAMKRRRRRAGRRKTQRTRPRKSYPGMDSILHVSVRVKRRRRRVR